MSTPVKRHTKRATNSRRSHHSLKAIAANSCESCGASVKPHYACQACGTYKGKQVIDVKKREARRARHLKPMS